MFEAVLFSGEAILVVSSLSECNAFSRFDALESTFENYLA